MKNIHIEKSRLVLLLEASGRTCKDILTRSQREVRFDLKYEDEDASFRQWRASVGLNSHGDVMLEIKDYESPRRYVRRVDDFADITDVSIMALNYSWNALPVTDLGLEETEIPVELDKAA